MNQIFLILGGNKGNRLENLSNARLEIERQMGAIQLSSPIYDTASWGKEDLPAHLNQVILIESTLDALETLNTILSIELELGRIRDEKWGMRTIDIDILFFNDEIVNLPQLTIPHPQIPHRRFTLIPMNDIAPHYIHPLLHKRMDELLALTEDMLTVKEYLKT